MLPGMTTTEHSVIRIEFGELLDPVAYAAMVHSCWALLVAGGHATTATVHPDGTATDEQLDEMLETLIAHSPWGW